MLMMTLSLLLTACETAPSAGPVDDATLACDVSDMYTGLTLTHEEALQIDWGEGEVWAVAVTSPGARIGAMGKLESGILYWQIAASDFGTPLSGPLVYGQVPGNATDYTTFAGGVFEELEPGRCYELQVSDPAHASFGRLQFRPQR